MADERKTVQSWFTAVSGAAGQSDRVKQGFLKRVQESGVPGILVGTRQETAGFTHAIKGFLKGTKHGAQEFIEIQNEILPGYVILAGSRDHGKLLLVSWYLMGEPRQMGSLARVAARTVHLNLMELSFLEQEELSAFASLIHDAIKGAVEEVMTGLNLDFAKVDTKTRGLINIS